MRQGINENNTVKNTRAGSLHNRREKLQELLKQFSL